MITLPPILILAVSAVILAALFVHTWKLSVRHDNYSFVDVSWSLAFTPIALWYATTGVGWLPRRIFVAVLVAVWSLRLGTHLWHRVASHHPKEDVRYAALRERWKGNLTKSFLWFFLAQGLLVWLLMLPVFLISQQTHNGFRAFEYAGVLVWLGALIGEGTADEQLKRFKATKSKAGEICHIGLWRYSRHPNYFFQSLLWWGLFLMALPSPWGWLSIAAPLAMLHFLLNVTGVPLTEELSVKKHGDVYREYQRTTNAFVPWFPKK